jgi:diadenosine tetraphosphatase ApaH/serine/threonine PP2A family protein phosphatase
MRAAVVSDIHSNLHALEAVFADIAAEGVDEVWCLGDVVGYGPRPNECCALVRERATVALCGNHDLAAVGSLDVAEFSGDAAVAARWTASTLEQGHREWLAALEPAGERADVELYHGSPRDPIWEYVLSEDVALLCLLETEAPLVLVGHSHVALAISWDGGTLAGGVSPGGSELDLSSARILGNPGSVGQPRDGDPRAAWLLLDTDVGLGTFRRIPYEIARTQAEIRELGLPDVLAARLAHGI